MARHLAKAVKISVLVVGATPVRLLVGDMSSDF